MHAPLLCQIKPRSRLHDMFRLVLDLLFFVFENAFGDGLHEVTQSDNWVTVRKSVTNLQ